MFKAPLLTIEEIKDYASTLQTMSDEELMEEEREEIRKGFWDQTFGVNDQKASACYNEFVRRGKLHFYQRAYNRARAAEGLTVSDQDRAAAADPMALNP